MKSSFQKILFPIVSVLIVALSSCSGPTESTTFIPKTAEMVMVINGKSLSEKSGIKDLTSTRFFSLIKDKLDEDQKSSLLEFEPIIKNPEESGINLKSEIYFFSFSKDSLPYAALRMKLLDKSRFESFINKIIEKSGKKVTITSLGTFSYISVGENAPIILWDSKQLFVFYDLRHHNDVAANAEIAKQVITEDKSESAASGQPFEDFLKNKKDISVWLNYKYLVNPMNHMSGPLNNMALLSKFSSGFKDYRVSVNCDFQQGQVDVSMKAYLNDQMKKALEENKVFKDRFDQTILKYFPENSYLTMAGALNVLGYYNLSMQNLKNFKVNKDQIDQIFQNNFGMTLQETLGEFSGEMVFDIQSVRFVKETRSYHKKFNKSGEKSSMEEPQRTVLVPKPLVSFGIQFNNDKFYKTLTEKYGGLLEKKDGYYALSLGKSNLYFHLFDKTLIGTNDLGFLKNIAAGNLKGHSLKNSEVARKLGKYPFYASINLNIDSYPKDFKTFLEDRAGDHAEALFKILSVYDKVECFSKTHYDWELIVKMKDHRTNSLKTIISSIDDNVPAPQ